MANLQAAGGSSLDGVDFGSGSRSPAAFWDSAERLRRKQYWSYFSAKQHDDKRVDFDGRSIQYGVNGVQPSIASAGLPTYTPLRNRRPSMPYRLPRLMVLSFTAMLLGEHRFPELLTKGDATTQDFVRGLSKAASLPVRLARMRNLGGATGTPCASWCYLDGKPRIRVHNSMHVHVHSWEDRDEHVPAHVSECRIFVQRVKDERGRAREVEYWYRRDWTKDADIVFVPVQVNQQNPEWIPDPSKSWLHNDGLCHFVTGQNLPSDEEGGESDLEGLLEAFDNLDIMLSILTRGAVLNLDPTLVLKMDPDLVDRGGVSKGSDHSLAVGESGDAKYLELAGTSIEKGVDLFNKERLLTLESGQCVIPDPDKVAAAGTSSVALKVVYKPMTDRVDMLREQYGGILKRLLEPMLAVARKKHRAIIFVPAGEVDPHTGQLLLEPKEYELLIDLPPIAKEDPSGDLGDDGKPKTVMVELEPGSGRHVDPEWPDYFLPTPSDQQATLTSVGGAAGGPGTAILSKKTASSIAAKAFGLDPDQEWQQLQSEQHQQLQDHLSMFSGGLGPSGGGASTKKLTLPSGASIQHNEAAPPPPPPAPAMPVQAPDSKSEKPEVQPIPVTPTLAAAAASVNEFRRMWGLEPLQGDDGDMPLAAYAAKYARPIAEAANLEQGKIGVAPANPPPAGPPKPSGMPGAGGPPGAPPHPLGPPPPFKK